MIVRCLLLTTQGHGTVSLGFLWGNTLNHLSIFLSLRLDALAPYLAPNMPKPLVAEQIVGEKVKE
ncbi:MAG TPA: hypothetical protein VNN62_19945 [Methylomirabilota bacterium]|jgi:hypothetical protein|nr:hypothetical protein [Methylomirabilota bacterium]